MFDRPGSMGIIAGREMTAAVIVSVAGVISALSN